MDEDYFSKEATKGLIEKFNCMSNAFFARADKFYVEGKITTETRQNYFIVANILNTAVCALVSIFNSLKENDND